MGELTMVVLHLTNADMAVSEEETDILNNFHRAVYGRESFALTFGRLRGALHEVLTDLSR
jgi:hypothetical protein